jgi:predicted nucleotidyltransferase
MLDITPQQHALLLHLLEQRLPHVRAVAFGSRVAGWPFGRGAKAYSDLDIALWSLRPSDEIALAHLRADLEESALPWSVDLSQAEDLPPTLRALVERHGALLRSQGLPEPAVST